MLFTSQIMTKASGSVGGLTASHNRFGQYMRARSTPVNPSTALQQAVRSIFANLAGDWSALTAAERAAWDTYAENVPVINKVGETIYLTGFNHYIRSNAPRLQAGLAVVDAAPTVYTLPTFTDPVIVYAQTSGLLGVTVAFTDTEPWVDEDGAAMLVFASQAKDPQINFFKGPFQSQEPIEGDATTPPTSPTNIGTNIPAADGNRIFTAIRLTRADGRLSERRIFTGVVS